MNDKYITPDIICVKVLNGYFIYLKFRTGEEKVYNMERNINELNCYKELKRREYFEKVKSRGDTIEWENGEDVCPESLYYDSIDYQKFIKDFKSVN